MKEETASAVLAPAVGAGLRNIQDEKPKRRSAHRTTAAIWFRFAPPKFLLHCDPQKLHIAAERYLPSLDYVFFIVSHSWWASEGK
jgi:hypothetical protein